MKKALFFLAIALMGLAANAQVAFEENFNGMTAGSTPTDWVTYSDNLTNYSSYSNWGTSWTVMNYDEAGTDKIAVSVSYTTVSQDCDRWMITPSINIPSTGYSLVFEVWGRSTTYPEKVSVRVSTTNTEKESFTEVLDVVMNGQTYTNGWNNVMVNLDAYAGQNIHIAFVNHGDGYYTLLDNVKVCVMPQNSLAFSGIEVLPYTALNGECTVQFAVQNTGLANLTSYDYIVTANGTQVGETHHVSGINVATFAYNDQTVTVPASALGQMAIAITASNPNGATDDDESDNSGNGTTTVFDPSTFTHSILLENFTTARCQYCPGGHERINTAIVPYENNVVWVAHHTGYGSDDMTLHESEEIAGYATGESIATWEWHPGLYAATAALDNQGYYTHGGTSAPAMAIDRNAAYAIEPESDGVVGSVGDVSDIANLFMRALSSPNNNLTIEWDGLSYNAQTREVKVTVKGLFLSNITDNLRLNLWVIEDGIAGTQVDANQGGTVSYIHNHVIRKFVTPTWGEASAFNMGTNRGNTYSKSYTFTLPNNINAQNAHLVAFVAKAGSSESVFTDRHVLNALQSRKLTDEHLDIESVDMEASMKVYPNPATEMAYISANGIIHSMTLTDVSGRKLQEINSLNANVIELNVSRLEAGFYFISVTTDEGTTTQKLNVVR